MVFSTAIMHAVFCGVQDRPPHAGLCYLWSTYVTFSHRDSVWAYFLRTCCENLHVVLCMSPAGDALRNRCRSFPGLIGSTYIDWVYPWPKQALYAVAQLFLSSNDLIPADYRDAIIEHVVHVHTTIQEYSKDYLAKLRRNNFVTPKHYLSFIASYLALLSK